MQGSIFIYDGMVAARHFNIIDQCAGLIQVNIREEEQEFLTAPAADIPFSHGFIFK